MLTKTSEIEQLNADAQGLLEWASVPLGSVLRTHSYSYPNWGITITPENIGWLVSESKKAFMAEWAETNGSMNHLIAEASEKAGLGDTNMLMNSVIAGYASEHLYRLLSAGKSPLIIDVGAGAGGTSLALARALAASPVFEDTEIRLTLLEPSEKRLATAAGLLKEAVQGTWLERSLRIHAVAGSAERLGSFGPESADVLITNAAIHHESFNFHLPHLLQVLRPGMPLISGDWHESNYEHPARAYWIYYLLQHPHDEETAKAVLDFVNGGRGPLLKERKELTEFRTLFSIGLMEAYSAFDRHTRNEREADAGSMRYWQELGKRFSDEGSKCPEFLLQCHERVSKRVESLTNAGFVFDDESRQKYKEVIRERGFGELGAVMVAKKRARV